MWYCGGQHSPGPSLRSRRPSALYPTLFQRRGLKTHASRGWERVTNRCYVTAQLPNSLVADIRHSDFLLPMCYLKVMKYPGRFKAHAEGFSHGPSSLYNWSPLHERETKAQWEQLRYAGAQNKSRGPPGSAACLLCSITHSFVSSSWLPCSQCLTWFCYENPVGIWSSRWFSRWIDNYCRRSRPVFGLGCPASLHLK